MRSISFSAYIFRMSTKELASLNDAISTQFVPASSKRNRGSHVCQQLSVSDSPSSTDEELDISETSVSQSEETESQSHVFTSTSEQTESHASMLASNREETDSEAFALFESQEVVGTQVYIKTSKAQETNIQVHISGDTWKEIDSQTTILEDNWEENNVLVTTPNKDQDKESTMRAGKRKHFEPKAKAQGEKPCVQPTPTGVSSDSSKSNYGASSSSPFTDPNLSSAGSRSMLNSSTLRVLDLRDPRPRPWLSFKRESWQYMPESGRRAFEETLTNAELRDNFEFDERSQRRKKGNNAAQQRCKESNFSG